MFVPLSSGEESYLRQEESRRRRQIRLLQVREEEKRIAYERTQWYKRRALESRATKRGQKVVAFETEKAVALSSLHEKYKAALAAIGDAQRQAEDYNATMHERAKRQLGLLASHDAIVEERFSSALSTEQKMQRIRAERECIIRENMRKVQEIADRQRRHAEKIAQTKAAREAGDRALKEEMARRVEEDAEYVVLPADLSTTRLHASARLVKRHNVRHMSAIDGWAEGDRKRLEEDVREQEALTTRAVVADRASARGVDAQAVVTAQREANEALNWLSALERQIKSAPERKDVVYDAAEKARGDAVAEESREQAFEALFGRDPPLDTAELTTPRARRPPAIPPAAYFPQMDDAPTATGKSIADASTRGPVE
ncbi:hypothetical protein ACHHYP_10016 [Achlya hypogyna]|uniref:Trichohyalin-plectin-homology domain-containing protein n=1 Tax=Achlya hypogyna TaxID=1202772 RepID=A0A1V9ZII7_ACHHY|nr:hypothetical protein ACHHYP_10016 [Achlya hypogyna]